MCAPMAVMAVASIASMAVSAYGAYQQGQAQSQAAAYQAQIAANNQKIALQNAEYAKQQGQQQETAQRMKTAQLIGSQRANMAANGVDISSGSAADIQADSAMLGELDAQTIHSNALRTSNNYLAQAGNYGLEAEMDKNASSNYATAGFLNTASTLLSGASSIGGKYMNYQKTGIWG